MTDHALVPLADNAMVFAPEAPTRFMLAADHAAAAIRRPRTWWLAIALASAAAGLVALGAPVLATGVVGLSFAQLACSVVLQTRASLADARLRWPYATPLEPEVPLHEVATPELRDTYGDVLRVYEEIRYALVEAEHLQPSMRAVFDRCHATALAAGQLARLGNPLRRYLQDHDPARMQAELERLTSKAVHAADREAARAYAHAAAARARQL
ncbi:MAG: hypothetical protein K8M05_21665, partial [Deltaproteobacteria bacterium]|nr:hypothetical protein [Kofleriaceae bacterium]